MQELMKKRELHTLQLQLKEQHRGKEEKKAIVHNKELEIRHLQDSISKLDAEILSAKEEISEFATMHISGSEVLPSAGIGE